MIAAATGCGGVEEYEYVYKQIPKHDWKYSHGYRIGDYLPIGALIVSNDTVYVNDSAVAVITDLELRTSDMVMMINSIHTNETGKYVSK